LIVWVEQETREADAVAQMLLDLREDVTMMLTGDTFPVTVGPLLRSSGWRGGTWVRYITPPDDVEEFVVEQSDGNAATGFLLFPSESYTPGEEWGAVNNFTGAQLRTDAGAVYGASTVTIIAGGGRMLFRVFETVPIDVFGVRSAGSITYSLNEPLKVSENGLLCNDSDARMALAGVAQPLTVGVCCAIPRPQNNFALGLDLKY